MSIIQDIYEERLSKAIKLFECFERTANFQNRPSDMGHWITVRMILTDILNGKDENLDNMLQRAEHWIKTHIGE